VNVQEDDTPGGPPSDSDRDVLAERRARRGEPLGDPILIRRAETAEAAAQALEDRLSGIQARLREAELESQSAAQRLAQREQELSSASERLSSGEQQLRSISTRLEERERELRSVSERLSDRERELQTVSERLADREQQLHRAELEIRGRVEALEQRVGEVQEDLARERAARQAAEGELQALQSAQAAVAPLIGELRQIAQRLRIAAESAASPPGPVPAAPPSEEANAQMAEALAAAVQRLRARVVAVGEIQESERQETDPEDELAVGSTAEAAPAPEDELAVESTAEAPPVLAESAPSQSAPRPAPSQSAPAPAPGIPYVPPQAVERAAPRAWLAPAIRRVAERRDPRLAAELVLELLPAQALAIAKPTRYLVKIAELGAYEISLADGRGAVRDLAGAGLIDSRTFLLEGPAAAFAEVAAGGSRLSAWRPPPGLRIRGGRRRAKRLLAGRRDPLALSELESAGVTVWPGLLLLALAEAIDPASTAGHSFTVVFAIEGQQSAELQVQAQQGRPLAVTRGPAQTPAAGEQPTAGVPGRSTVHLSERAFARLITAQDLAGESVAIEGDRAPLQTLLSWTDRVQGIRRLPA
jgi:hypothetical protein